jgi:hypothetical protein
MVALVYVADASDLNRPSDAVPSIVLKDDATYWFLYRYFEAANLDPSEHLIDLYVGDKDLLSFYGGRIIEGYQLHRLRQELEQAFQDVQFKPPSWRVLVGWNGSKKSAESEDWKTVQKDDVLSAISSLLALVYCADTSDLKLICFSD